MSTSLARRNDGPHPVPALCSAVLPGLGQMVKGDTDKGVGILVVAVVAGSSFVAGLPLVGAAAGVVAGVTWLYGVVDAAFAKKK